MIKLFPGDKTQMSDPKFSVGETVFYLQDNTLVPFKITAVRQFVGSYYYDLQGIGCRKKDIREYFLVKTPEEFYLRKIEISEGIIKMTCLEIKGFKAELEKLKGAKK